MLKGMGLFSIFQTRREYENAEKLPLRLQRLNRVKKKNIDIKVFMNPSCLFLKANDNSDLYHTPQYYE